LSGIFASDLRSPFNDKSGEIGKARPANNLETFLSFSSLQLPFAAQKRFVILPLPINLP